MRASLEQIAAGHPVSRIDELMPWKFMRAAQDNVEQEGLN
jgi:hypothetical protein